MKFEVRRLILKGMGAVSEMPLKILDFSGNGISITLLFNALFEKFAVILLTLLYCSFKFIYGSFIALTSVINR